MALTLEQATTIATVTLEEGKQRGFAALCVVVPDTRGHPLALLRDERASPGRLADILLVAGDPTAEVTILQNKASLLAIMKGGAFHKPPAAT
jgi:precorrin-6B methylase 1